MKLYIIKKEKGKKYDSPDVYEKLFGKKLFYSQNGAPIDCSISHTKNYWSVIESEGSIGLDIEEKGRDINQSVVKRLHPLEQEYMKALSYGSSEWTEEFLSIWTAKEAWLKLKGSGISGGLSEFSVITDDLLYKTELDGYLINHIIYKNLVICVISSAQNIEIADAKYAGKTAKDCISYAGDLLALRSYSNFDLAKRLKLKGYNEDEVKETTERLSELGYLNDAEYALRFAEQAKSAGKGSAYIRQKLILSGISSDLIPENDALCEYENALEIAKGIYHECDDPEEKKKLLAKVGRRLSNRGFSPSIVYKVLANLRD